MFRPYCDTVPFGKVQSWVSGASRIEIGDFLAFWGIVEIYDNLGPDAGPFQAEYGLINNQCRGLKVPQEIGLSAATFRQFHCVSCLQWNGFSRHSRPTINKIRMDVVLLFYAVFI